MRGRRASLRGFGGSTTGQPSRNVRRSHDDPRAEPPTCDRPAKRRQSFTQLGKSPYTRSMWSISSATARDGEWLEGIDVEREGLVPDQLLGLLHVPEELEEPWCPREAGG